MSSELLGVLIGGGLTLIGGVAGQAASHAFALRRERENRREARIAALADVRMKAILELQQAATAIYAEAAMRPSLSTEALQNHQSQVVSGIVTLAVPQSRIDDQRTDELTEAFVNQVIAAGRAYDEGGPKQGNKAMEALRLDLQTLMNRTAELLGAERSALKRSNSY